jgi:dTDP-4-dehydrorhamnose 3,5-epimerase
MQIKPIAQVEGAFELTLSRHWDNRGFFQELFSTNHYPFTNFKQVNVSCSSQNVIRGIHKTPFGKLCSCLEGELCDIIVDLRPESPTYKNWYKVWLTAGNSKQIYIPPNCGHGFFASQTPTLLLYLQEDTYNPAVEETINWKDPTLAIAWPPAKKHYIVSDKDNNAPFLDK